MTTQPSACPTQQHSNGKEYPYQLTTKPDTVEWKPTYYVYVEKKGHFKETAKAAWDQFFAHVDKLDSQVTREKHLSQYRMDVDPWVYRAGFTVSSKPTTLPDGYHVTELDGGSYLRFVLTGAYEHLGEACGRVFDIIGKEYQCQQRKDWNMEYYVNDPKQVKPEELITEILVPIYTSNCEHSWNSSSTYQLTEKPDVVEWKPCYFVYVEKKGHFMETARAAWGQFMAHIDKIDAQVTRLKHVSQYRMDVDPWLYRAGYIVDAKPTTLPEDFHCIEFPGGSYLRFILTGGYQHLEAACKHVYDMVDKEYAQQRRKDWNMEYYVNDMKKVKSEELITEILVPIKSETCNECKSSPTYQLTETPETVEWKSYYFVYIEKRGHFKDTAKACWDELKLKLAEIKAQTTIDKYIAQYGCDTEPWVYRAGVTVSSPPTSLPDDYHVEQFSGGSYLSFTLTGGYQHLPEACGRVWEIVGQKYSNQVKKQEWNIEYYVNDCAHVKPQDLITQIMIPINKSTCQ